MMAHRDFDVAILGGGLAGLSLAMRLTEPRFAGLRLLVVEPRETYRRDRTWSYWTVRPHPFADCVAMSWRDWAVAGHDRHVVRKAAGLRYETIHADALYARALARLRAAPDVTLHLGCLASAEEEDDAVRIRYGAQTARAAIAFDTRPPAGFRRQGLTQLFGGQEIETESPVFDPGTAMLMDFRCEQSGAAHFTYVLPSTNRRALVEDTWFAGAGFQPPDHRGAIRHYMQTRYGISRYRVVFEEQGALPMDPAFRPRTGRRLLPFGTAGGATRPSTGYAFVAIQAQCDAAAAALAAGRVPLAPPARPAMVRMMDHVLLDLLAQRPDLAPRVFSALFARCEPGALVRFLNDLATPADFVSVAAAIPFLPTVGAALRLAAGRVPWPQPAVAG
jgi:lycopene beta-cyclase